MTLSRRVLFLLPLLLFFSSRARCADTFEIQVYDGRIDDVGQSSLEVHLNNVIRGITTPSYQGQVPDHNLTHLTFEFARGMTPEWELGAYLQTALLPGGEYDFAGAKLRSKFVVAKEVAERWHLGANFELAYVPSKFEQNLWSGEIRPVIGYEIGAWTLLANPILGVPVSAPNDGITFEPAFKIMTEAVRHVGIGLEYYSDLGRFNELQPISTAEQYLYATYDLIDGPCELNLGIGRGLNSSSNFTTAKMIVGFDF